MSIDYYQLAREFTKSKLEELRIQKNRGYLKYLQVGACDGEFDDFAFYATTKQDHGILVEPNPVAFKMLQQNKKDYLNCTLLNYAILPEKFKNRNLRFRNHVTPSGPPFGSTFVEIGEPGLEPAEVSILTVKELLTGYVKEPVDCLFVDVEGLDADLVFEYTQYAEPDFILFESWNYTEFHLANWNNIDLMYRADCIDHLKNKGYTVEQFRDDICAFK